MSILNRPKLFSEDITLLETETHLKRMMQFAVSTSAVIFPLASLLLPNQKTESRLWEMALGSLLGMGSTVLVSSRQTLEKKHQAFVGMDTDFSKGAIGRALSYHESQQKINSDRNLANSISALPEYMQLRYVDEFKLQGLLPPTTVELLNESNESNESKSNHWTENSFSYRRKSNAQSIDTPTFDWILQIVEEAVAPYDKRNHQHLIINAPTQSGKSTLAATFIGLFCKILDGQVETLVIDPKHSDTNWLVPVDYAGFENAHNGIKTAIKVLDERKNQAKIAKDKGLEKPDFVRYLIILDEWNILYGQGKGYAQIISKEMAEEMLADVQRLLNESAFLNMTLFLIGQSPLSGDNGLSRPIMENATRITLNKTAIRWLNDKDFPNVELKAPFKRQINAWLRDKKRCALINPMVGEPYCELIPIINLNAFETVDVEDETITEDTQEAIPTVNKQVPETKLNPVEIISKWYYEVFEKCEHYPNDATLKQAWFEITGQNLTEQALNDLRKLIEQNHEKNNEDTTTA